MKTNSNRKDNIRFIIACLYFASLNFEVFAPFIPNLSVAKIAAFLYIIVSFLTSKDLFLVKKIKTPLYSALIMFFLMVFSSIINLQNNRSLFDTTLFLNIMMFWMLINHQRQDERVFEKGFFWFSVTSFVVGVFYFLNIGVTVGDDMRVVVFGENANGLGIKMGVGALYLVNYCLAHTQDKLIYRPWLLLMALPMVSLLLATASRVSILILGVGFVLFVLLRPMKRKGSKVLWLLVGLVALYYGYNIVLKQDVLMSRVERTIDEGSVSGRDYLWLKYLDLIQEHPILGVGFTGAEQYAIEVFGKNKSPHNVIIEVALYSGVLGLAFFLTFLYCVISDAIRFLKKKQIIGPLILCSAIIGMVLSGQALGEKLFWTLSVYAVSYRVIPHVALINSDLTNVNKK